MKRLQRPSFKDLRANLSAGLTTALVTIPDAMASAILAGLNPIYGLYAVMVGTPIAALLSSSHFMYVANTGALAVGTGNALAGFEGEQKVQAMVVLVLLVGLIQLGMGLLRLGGLLRFVANAVLIGFMTGIAVRIILSQLGELTGYHSKADNVLLRALDLLLHLDRIDLITTLVGLGTLAAVFLIQRTRLEALSMVIALLGATLLVAVAGLGSVPLMRDIADIPSGFPAAVLPDLTLVTALLPAAASLAIIGLVQGVGVSKTVPNPDGNYPNVSRDFAAKGAANIAAGFFQGMPIGGTMSETAVNVSAGARSRWANVFSGLIIVTAVLVLGGWIEYLAMPAIAALLVVAGIEAIKPDRINDVWHAGWEARLILVATFAATLILPIQEAVLLGVLLSMGHYLYESSVDVRLVELQPLGNGSFAESPAPASLAPGQVVVLQVYGSLYYAASMSLEQMLPSTAGARGAVVILRLRGPRQVGSTLVTVLERYAKRVRRDDATLMLAELSPELREQLVKTDTLALCGEHNAFLAEADLFGATRQAIDQAHARTSR